MTKPRQRTVLLIAASVASLCSGCSVHKPLLVKDQARLIVASDKRLRGMAETVQAKINDAGAAGALVIVSASATDAPLIFPTSSPLEAAAKNQAAVTAGQACLFVTKRTAPIPPQRVNCIALARDAKEIGEAAEKIKKAESDVQTMGKLVGSMASLVEFHDHQLKSLETSLTTLVSDYGRSATAVETNNAQVASIITDLNKEFQQIQTTLTAMQQRLAKIK